MTLLTRGRGGRSVQLVVDRAVRGIAPDFVPARSETLQDAIALGLGPQRLLVAVAGGLGFVGLLLAAMGIHGMMAYAIALRRREFAIRIALGAPRTGIVWMVLRHGLVTLALVAVAAVLACYVPARRAIGAEPLRALRSE